MRVYTRGVTNRSSFRVLLSFIALALIVVRTGEAHLHLCLEGGETSSAFHATDLGTLCADDVDRSASAPHSDQDIDLGTFSGTLAKSDLDVPFFAALPPFDLLALMPPERSRGELLEVPRDPQPKLPYLFLPLFRGPPV